MFPRSAGRCPCALKSNPPWILPPRPVLAEPPAATVLMVRVLHEEAGLALCRGAAAAPTQQAQARTVRVLAQVLVLVLVRGLVTVQVLAKASKQVAS